MKRDSPELSISKPKKIDKLDARIVALMLLIYTDKKISETLKIPLTQGQYSLILMLNINCEFVWIECAR
jgi:hypothetical protein